MRHVVLLVFCGLALLSACRLCEAAHDELDSHLSPIVADREGSLETELQLASFGGLPLQTDPEAFEDLELLSSDFQFVFHRNELTRELVEGPAPLDHPGEVCLFIHGAGVGLSSADHLDWVVSKNKNNWSKNKGQNWKNMRKYWGKVAETLLKKKACRTIVIRRTDTNYRAWDNDSLIRTVCQAVEQDPLPSVVFSHSMGNLVIAAGIAYGYKGCDRFVQRKDTDGVYSGGAVWFGLQGPIHGTGSAVMCRKNCAGTIKANLLDKVALKVAAKVCGCGKDKKHPKRPFPAIASCAPDFQSSRSVNGVSLQLRKPKNAAVTPGVKTILVSSITHKYMWGNLCGVSALPTKFRPLDPNSYVFGSHLLTKKFVGLGADSKTVFKPKARKFRGTDGVVEFSSCSNVDSGEFRADPSSPFYALKGNHFDGTGRYGDVKGKPAKQPLSWMVKRVQSVAEVRANEVKKQRALEAEQSEEAEENEEEDGEKKKKEDSDE